MSEEKPKKKLKYVTLIWEQLPEDVCFYVIPTSEIEKVDRLMLRACHNNWINASDVDTTNADRGTVDRSLCRLLNLLTNPESSWINDEYIDDQATACKVTAEEMRTLIGKWHGYKLDTSRPRTIPRSKVYRSGFLS